MHHEEGPLGRSHWDELAEQLGLPPDNTPTAARAKPPEPTVHRQESNLDDMREHAEDKPADTLHAPERLPEEDTGPEDDRPARRRRGRRGGRRHREAREESGSGSARRSRSAGRSDKRPRKARHSRGTDEPLSQDMPDRNVDLEEVQDEHDVEPQAPPNDSGETDDEEMEKISDWNVPSWAEIVSGLYRP
jgi:hypothetical protein